MAPAWRKTNKHLKTVKHCGGKLMTLASLKATKLGLQVIGSWFVSTSSCHLTAYWLIVIFNWCLCVFKVWSVQLWKLSSCWNLLRDKLWGRKNDKLRNCNTWSCKEKGSNSLYNDLKNGWCHAETYDFNVLMQRVVLQGIKASNPF